MTDTTTTTTTTTTPTTTSFSTAASAVAPAAAAPAPAVTTTTAPASPPQTQLYSSLADDIVQQVDDSEYLSATTTSHLPTSTPLPTTPLSSSPQTPSPPTQFKSIRSIQSNVMTDNSTTTSPAKTTNNGGVPKINLPVASGKSRLRSVLMWQEPRTTTCIFLVLMLFFYLTLWRGLSILSVCGALLSIYLIIGLLIVQTNQLLNGPFDNYIKKPPKGSIKFFRKSVVDKWSERFMNIGNEYMDDLRDVLYCDNASLTLKWIAFSGLIYFLGIWFSPLVLLFVLTISAFSVPVIYSKNKKVIDHNVDCVWEVGVKQAHVMRETAANKAAPYLEKAHPWVKSTAEKIGLGPQKKKS